MALAPASTSGPSAGSPAPFLPLGMVYLCVVVPLCWLMVGLPRLDGAALGLVVGWWGSPRRLPARALRTRHWRDAFGVCSVPPVRILRAYELCNARQKLGAACQGRVAVRRAYYAVGGPFIRQDGSAGPLEGSKKPVTAREESIVVAARTHGQTTPRGVKFEAL